MKNLQLILLSLVVISIIIAGTMLAGYSNAQTGPQRVTEATADGLTDYGWVPEQAIRPNGIGVQQDKWIVLTPDPPWVPAEQIHVYGPTYGHTVPFTVTQLFHVPPGTSEEVFGTIAAGPCWVAEFVGATSGYVTGGTPPGNPGVCGWIRWLPPNIPTSVVTVTVRYSGHWLPNIYNPVSWYADHDPYCFRREPDCNEFGCACQWATLKWERQPLSIWLPMIKKNSQ